MEKWLRTDPSDHTSWISSGCGAVGDLSRVSSFGGLGFHVGRCELDDLVLSDREHAVVSSCLCLRCAKYDFSSLLVVRSTSSIYTDRAGFPGLLNITSSDCDEPPSYPSYGLWGDCPGR